MDFKEFLRYGSSSVALLIAGASAAQALTVTQTINVNSALTQGGGAATGQFDITGLLTPASSFNQPYDVVSATITAYGYSAPDATPVVGNYNSYSAGTGSHFVQTGYSCGWFSSCSPTGYTAYDYYYNSYRTITNSDPVSDTILLSAGGDSFGGTVTGHDTSTVSFNVFDGSATYGSYQSGYSYYNFYTTTVNDILFGALSAGGALSATALADLAQDGLLSFSVDASIGQFTLQSLTLDVTVNENASQADIATPEPAPVAPISAGLLLLMLYRRIARKRRDKA